MSQRDKRGTCAGVRSVSAIRPLYPTRPDPTRPENYLKTRAETSHHLVQEVDARGGSTQRAGVGDE